MFTYWFITARNEVGARLYFHRLSGGMCGYWGGMRGCQGVCVVAGGVWWGVCVVARGACVGYDEIRSMNGRYTSYWNAFLYRSGTVNSKSFVGKVFLRIKRKFELTYAL